MEGHGPNKAARASIAKGKFDLGLRDLCTFLGDWSALKQLDGLKNESARLL